MAFRKLPSGFYEVKCSLRSKRLPHIRTQKKITLIDGKPIRTEAEARRAEKKLREQVRQELFKRENSGSTWKQVIQEWKEELSKGRGVSRTVRESTVNDYIHLLETYASHWNSRYPSDITKADVQDVIRVVEATISKAATNRMRSALNKVFNWGIDNRRMHGLSVSPVVGVSIPYNKKEKRPEVYTHEEQKHLLRSAKALRHPWYPVWAVALSTGLRDGELFALKWAKIDFHNKLILVEESYDKKTKTVGPTKGRKWRQVPINPALELLLKELKLQTGGSGFVLPRLKGWDKGYQARILKTFCREIQLKPLKAHALRGSFATELMRQGVAPAVVRKICGWEDSEVMEHYMDLAALGVSGATNGLRIIPDNEAVACVQDLIPRPRKK